MKDLDQHNIEQSAPILFSIKKEHNLEVPKGYLENLPKELLSITKGKTISINKNWFYAISIAAVILIGLFIIKPNQSTSNYKVVASNDSFENLTAEDFEALLLLEETDYLANFIDFDATKELQISDTELQSPLKTNEITGQDFENYFESEIENYY